MFGWYSRWIDRWETRLATRDRNRVVRPFEWGLDWLEPAENHTDPYQQMSLFVDRAVRDSEAFFAYQPPAEYHLQEGVLTFPSAVQSPYPENNTVYADYFPAASSRRAVLVLPQWNAGVESHAGLCKLLNRFGISALKMSLAYHDRRMPGELERADYHMSSNLGRTIHATRQSVIDARSCLDWLVRQGYERLGVVGTSLGSCVAFITAAHDQRVQVGVFNHVSLYVGDVVWTGLSTQHVRKGLEQQISREELRRFWLPISPGAYLQKMAGRRLPSLLIWARYDTSFLPELSLQVLKVYKDLGIPHEVFSLPCAHYTTGQFPFNWMDGLAICRFLYRKL